MRKSCVGDANENEELDESSNFFAIRSTYEGSFDGKTWYKEGDLMYCALTEPGVPEKRKVQIINDDGSFTLEDDDGFFYMAGYFEDNDFSIEQEGIASRRFFMIREKVQFSIDLKKWYGIGYSCDIVTNKDAYEDYSIMNIFDDGIILIGNGQNTERLNYQHIKSIHAADKRNGHILTFPTSHNRYEEVSIDSISNF